MAKVKDKIVNGVDVEQLREKMDVMKAQPEMAKFRFSADGRWVEGAYSSTTINEFYGAGETHSRGKSFVLEQDDPPLLLGRDRGATPVEYLLAGLAGCLTTGLAYIAAARGIRIEEVKTRLDGDIDLRGYLGLSDKVRSGYQEIRVSFQIKADASEETLKELVELAQKRSPVFDVVSNKVPVKVDFEKN